MFLFFDGLVLVEEEEQGAAEDPLANPRAPSGTSRERGSDKEVPTHAL